MNCENCRNLKVGSFNFKELKIKWNEIYSPTLITEGYERRMIRESDKTRRPFKMTKMKYVYCKLGILNRFYIIRGKAPLKLKACMHGCKYYS
jgi:hypothetical protein